MGLGMAVVVTQTFKFQVRDNANRFFNKTHDIYYNVIKELHDIGMGDMSTTEDFYYNIQDCYEKMLDTNECIDELIEMQGENE